MRDILIAYIMGANQGQLEDLSKHIIDRQTTLTNTREMNLRTFRRTPHTKRRK